MKKKIKTSIIVAVVGLGILPTFFIGSLIIEEKYCYNIAFIELENGGLELGAVPQEFKKMGYSPLQVGGTPGYKEWKESYLTCKNNFNLFNLNFAIFGKSYPYYDHFIDW